MQSNLRDSVGFRQAAVFMNRRAVVLAEQDMAPYYHVHGYGFEECDGVWLATGHRSPGTVRFGAPFLHRPTDRFGLGE